MKPFPSFPFPLVTLLMTLSSVCANANTNANTLTSLLTKGSLVRVEQDKEGRYKEGMSIADVNAPVELVWKILMDFESYRFFMPRIEKIKVKREGADYLVDFKLDTPFVSTQYTNRYTPKKQSWSLFVVNAGGDLKGSYFLWRLEPLGPKKTRIYYSGVVKNYSSLAERLEDKQQTITIGINVASLLAALNAVQKRAETLAAASKTRPRNKSRP